MQYVRSFSGSVSKTWNSLNPATLSGAIDVIVVEQEDGTLACSPFHVRFGKISLLRPYDKKVEFRVNNVKQHYSMKLGEGGEAFFVFETSAEIPESLQTSPLISPAGSPASLSTRGREENQHLQEPEYLDLSASAQSGGGRQRPLSTVLPPRGLPFPDEHGRAQSDFGNITPLSSSPRDGNRPVTSAGPSLAPSPMLVRSASVRIGERSTDGGSDHFGEERPKPIERISEPMGVPSINESPDARSTSPPPLTAHEALNRAMALSKKLSATNIPTHITETGDLMLDMTGYKSSEDDALRAEVIARKVLAEELDGNYDIGALIGADEQGNLWIYSSEEAKEAALRKLQPTLLPPRKSLDDAASDPGYHSDDDRLLRDSSDAGNTIEHSAVGLHTPPQTPPEASAGDPNRNYAKTLRLTSDQLKALNLTSGENSMSFTVNKATCQASMFYWKYNVPVVISDIDGTITKSDALGHVLNMIGRDWTHLGVAKLYRDIVANGYNIFYLTSRSVGQADTTRNYLSSIVQDGYKLPRGPVILSPDRTVAALRREVYLRKPEVFKMACLRDIMTLFNQRNPFYAGFGNRFTDALSYRSVNIPSNRIFTINSNAEVSLDLLTLSKYKSSYVSMQEILDHFFPPVGLLVASGGESYTDFNYWRDTPLELDEFSASDSDEGSEGGSVHHSVEEGSEVEEEYDEEDDDEEIDESMRESFMSQDSLDEGADLIDSVNRHMSRNERSSRELGRSGSVSPSASNRLAHRGRSPQRPTSR